jgi:hypothetical protein
MARRCASVRITSKVSARKAAGATAVIKAVRVNRRRFIIGFLNLVLSRV